ncbi:MAG: TaqI-like C-terminal specificity domain-containing protein [Coleofasciculus chthonoplastes F3-SA18-01]|uniref:Eco57I restriction-modification methylase domain-containing protein n=1 Tax=Coleofasciculus chthonoplastes TaxID=64178 RepID=UPI003302D35E
MRQPEFQQSILDILASLQGLNPLKELFWSELNYDRENQPLSRRGWSDPVSLLLAEDPLLLASADNEFHIIYGRLQSERLLASDQRPVVNQLLNNHPYALFIFSNYNQDQWHFLNVKYDKKQDKRQVFRRITVSSGEQLRTATERLSLLDLAGISGVDPLTIQQRHDQAFDVEKVTQKFFETYRRVFEQVEGLLEPMMADGEQRRMFTQRLFNRLMFIAFIQKKGWLTFQGKRNYLEALWQDYQDKYTSESNFYRDRLSLLFFSGLNNPQQQDITGINQGGFLQEVMGTVPYLNGGLFEQDADDQNPEIIVPDQGIEAIILDLFASFNFTVTESTPLDVEVAVDPEMLGKVFEELVTGRHETGSYYTPKPIVSFMCREALKGYLRCQLTAESVEAIEAFVDQHNPMGLINPEAVLGALRKVKVCDPACGSGAYLLGMLHELLELRQCLFATRKIDAKTDYARKLEIIETNIYGVDSDVFAVNIARLRLWLSLAVEYEGDDPPPLPNLKFKIEVGDSLIAPNPQAGLGMFRDELISRYRETKGAYLKAHSGGEKLSLEQEIQRLKGEIALLTHGSIQVSGFDWAVEFAEVMADGGFDIQVANPPYVRQELIKGLKPALKQVYPEVYTGTSDLYCFFYARALQLLQPGGMLAFISSNKWFRAKYGEKLRGYIAETCQVNSITDFGELPVFQSASTFPMIFIAAKDNQGKDSVRFTQVDSLSPPYPDVLALSRERGQVLPSGALSGGNWMLTDAATVRRIKQMESVGVPLGEYVDGKIYYGIKTGFNQAFVIDGKKREELIRQDAKSEEIIKPLAVGKDIRKWCIDFQERWLIVTRIGIDIKRYPAIFSHLKQWQPKLEKRYDKGKYWWELRACDYYDIFGRSKILYPDIAKEQRFSLDTIGYYTLNTTYFIPSNDLYLLAVLNSSLVWKYCQENLTVLGDANKSGRLRFFSQFVEKIPIPQASDTEKEAISALVQKCLDAKGMNCEKWEKEIDERVAALYGL